MTPTAVRLPRRRKGGESLKFSVRKPMAVVTLVRKTGWALISMASTMASWLATPARRRWSQVTMMWTESATASVRMMVGADALVGSRKMPSHPAAPMTVTVARRITTSVPSVPPAERRTATTATTSARNIRGITPGMSRMGASAKAMLSMAMPVVWISSPG